MTPSKIIVWMAMLALTVSGVLLNNSYDEINDRLLPGIAENINAYNDGKPDGIKVEKGGLLPT